MLRTVDGENNFDFEPASTHSRAGRLFPARDGMIRLLFLRVVPLLLRPAAVVLEGALVSDSHVLVLLLPVAMMALTVSSIPVHLDYFRSHAGRAEYALLGRRYSDALSWLGLLSLFILAGLLLLLPLGFGPILIGATCLTFLIEKLADETSRALEFRKAFVQWFLVQSLRSGWFILPIAVTMVGFGYKQWFLIFSGLICLLMFLTFLHITGLRPRLTKEGLRPIRENLVFLVGSFLPAAYRQMPRLLVAKLFPEHAHLYLAIAQLCQGGSVIFTVRYQMPYRNLIARRPKLFQKRMWPVMRRLLVPVMILALVYLAGAIIGLPILQQEEIVIAFLLLPILIADTIMFSVLGAHLGYIPWFAKKWSALTTYIVCIGSAVLLAASLVSSGLWRALPIFGVPTLTILTGSIWLAIVVARHFPWRLPHA